MNRRRFLTGLAGCLAVGVAPAIVLRADALMRVVPRETTVLGLDLAVGGDESALLVGEVGRYEGIIIRLCEPQRLANKLYSEALWAEINRSSRLRMFVVPPGVSTVRATMVGGGGGGRR